MTSIFQKLTNSVSSNTPSGSGGKKQQQQQETNSSGTNNQQIVDTASKYPLTRSVVNELEAIFLDNEDVDESQQRRCYDDDDEQNNKKSSATKSPLNQLNGSY